MFSKAKICLVVCIMEQFMKVSNFHAIYFLGVDESVKDVICEKINIREGKLPFTYLGCL